MFSFPIQPVIVFLLLSDVLDSLGVWVVGERGWVVIVCRLTD